VTPLNDLAQHTTMSRRRGAPRTARGSARDARIRRSFDGVVASYIRELSPAGHTTRPAGTGRSRR
jgi:hypothetical protein